MIMSLLRIRLLGILSRLNDSRKKPGSMSMVIAGIVFFFLLILLCFFLLYSSMAPVFYEAGMGWGYFSMAALLSVVIMLVMNIFLVFQEVYQAKDNELLMAMPIRTYVILLTRILSLLVVSWGYEAAVFLPAGIVWMVHYSLAPAGMLFFLLEFLLLPLFALTLSLFVSWVIAHALKLIGKLRNLVMIAVFTAAFGIYLVFVGRSSALMEILIRSGISIVETVRRVFPPLYYAGTAPAEGSMAGMLVTAACAVIPFAAVIALMSHGFVSLAGVKDSHEKKKLKASAAGSEPVMHALVRRELRHYFDNVMVILNGAMGIIMAIIFVAALIYYRDTVALLRSLPFLRPYLFPAAFLGIMICSSLNVMSSAMISLEGNRLYILKSLPLAPRFILDAKLAAHLILSVPGGVILALVLSFVLRLSLLEAAALLVLPHVFTVFVGLCGLMINLSKPNFDWVNETACIKRTLSPTLTVFLSMGLIFALAITGIYGVPGEYLWIYILASSVVFAGFDVLLFRKLHIWGTVRFEELQQD